MSQPVVAPPTLGLEDSIGILDPRSHRAQRRIPIEGPDEAGERPRVAWPCVGVQEEKVTPAGRIEPLVARPREANVLPVCDHDDSGMARADGLDGAVMGRVVHDDDLEVEISGALEQEIDRPERDVPHVPSHHDHGDVRRGRPPLFGHVIFPPAGAGDLRVWYSARSHSPAESTPQRMLHAMAAP